MESNKTKAKMTKQVFRRFEQDILGHVLKPGDRLPSERELHDELGVSRWTIREAYRLLRQKGLVEIKHGEGTFVTVIDEDLAGTTINTLIKQKGVSQEHLQEFRETIEGRCAIYAVERATDDQITRFRTLFEQLKQKHHTDGDDLEFYEFELKLHAEIAKMSRNPLFEWFADTFRKATPEFGSLSLSGKKKSEAALQDWAYFVKALEQREGMKASMILANHIFKYRYIIDEIEIKRDKD